MFQKFTDQARRVMVLAMEEATGLNHGYIGTEHLLLGLLRSAPGTAAAKVLDAAGITLAAARQQVESIIGRGEQAATGHLPFTPRSKKVLELSMRESTRLGHNQISTGHLLLGLIREGGGVAVQILEHLGANLGDLRDQAALEAHDQDGIEGPPPSEVPRPAVAAAPRRADEILAALGRIETRLTAIERHLAAGVPAPGEPAVAASDEPAVAASDELARLRAEIARLEAVVREHGIEPG